MSSTSGVVKWSFFIIFIALRGSQAQLALSVLPRSRICGLLLIVINAVTWHRICARRRCRDPHVVGMRRS